MSVARLLGPRARLLYPSAAALALALAGCPTSHDAPDAAGGTDASSVDAPALDAPSGPGCDVPSACALRSASCCGSCGAPTPDDMIALPVGEVAAYADSVCADTFCPACAAMWDPYLLATCRAGDCVAIDLHVDPLTACAIDADCTLTARTCCACGTLGAGEVVAIAPAGGSFGALICDPDVDCPPCVPDFGTLEARCLTGRCEVVSP